jgi:cell division protein ZapA (FtsZ GTPase activity inhibitor)
MSEKESKTIEIQIYGKSFRLRTDEDFEYVQGLAHKIDSIMKEVGRGQLDIATSSVFVAIKLADDLEKLKIEHSKLQEEMTKIQDEIRSLNDLHGRLDKVLDNL